MNMTTGKLMNALCVFCGAWFREPVPAEFAHIGSPAATGCCHSIDCMMAGKIDAMRQEKHVISLVALNG